MPALDGIRALAIAWVFAFHAYALLAGGLLEPPKGPVAALAEKGLLGVQLFFVLSGFLLGLPWMRAAREGLAAPATLAFYRRRARRILPAFWLHLAILFGVILPLLWGGYALLGSPVGILNLALHPFVGQFLHPGGSSSLGLNMALWSLTLEAQFYLLLPLLAPAFTGRRVILALPAALVTSVAWKLWAPEALGAWLYARVDPALLVYFDPLSGRPLPFPPEAMHQFVARQLPGELAAFALGLAAANLYQRVGERHPSTPTGRLFLGLLGIALLLGLPAAVAQVPVPELMTGRGWLLVGMPLFLLGCTLLILLAALGIAPLRLVLGNPPVTWIGILSFSLYLWHEPVLRLLALRQGHWPLWTQLGAAVLLSLAVAALSFALAERPWLRRRARAPQQCTAPALGPE